MEGGSPLDNRSTTGCDSSAENGLAYLYAKGRLHETQNLLDDFEFGQMAAAASQFAGWIQHNVGRLSIDLASECYLQLAELALVLSRVKAQQGEAGDRHIIEARQFLEKARHLHVDVLPNHRLEALDAYALSFVTTGESALDKLAHRNDPESFRVTL